MTYSLRCLVGSNVYEIPEFQSATLGYDFSEVSGISLQYLKNGINSSKIDDGAVVVAYWNGVEPFDSRWMIQAGSGSDNLEENVITRTGKSLLDIFRRVIVLTPVGQPAGDKVIFNAANAGGILGNLFAAAQLRGAMTGITWDFTNTLDSSGVAWSQVISLDYAPGLKYIDLMRNLVDQGIVELRFNGNVLQAFNADAMGRDLALPGASQVELRSGLDYTELPTKWSTEDRAKYAYVLGEDNIVSERINAGTISGPFGREEIGIGQGGTKDLGTLALVGDAALDRVSIKREEFIRKVKIREDGKVPSVDYRVSDYVLERVADIPARYRIRSMAIEISTDGSIGSASIVLNDKFLENEIRTVRRVNGIIGGASVDGSGNGVPSSSPAVDVSVPNPVTGLISTSDYYVDQAGASFATVSLDWNAPTTNTDNSSLADLRDYEIQWKYGTGGWRTLTSSTSDTTWSSVPVNAVVSYQVRAVDNSGRFSTWVAGSLTTANDLVPPPVPSTPVVSSTLGTVTVSWDGLGSAGQAMPVDFSHIEVHMGSAGLFTADATTLLARYTGKSLSVVTGLVAGTSRYFKFISVDRGGNRSVASVEASAVIVRISGADLEANSVTTNELKAGSVTAEVLNGKAIDGKIITGATIRTAADGARFEVDTFGARLYDAVGNLDVNLPTDSGQAAYFAGDILATGLTIVDFLSLQGVNNEFAAQSVTTLQSGVMPPASAPAVALGFPEVPVSTTNYDGVNYYRGFWATPGGGGFSRGWLHFNPYSATDYGMKFHIERFDFAGNLLSTSVEMGWGGDDVIGACEVGGRISILSTGYQDRNYGLRNFDATTGAPGSSGFVDLPVGSFEPTIFADASWVYVAYMTATQVIIQRRDPGSLTLLGTYTGANGGLKRPLTSGMGPANFDFGSARFILTTDVVGAWGYVFTISGSTLTLAQANDSWPIPKGEVPHGIAWDGTRFWSAPADRPERWLKLSTINWTTESSVWWAAYSWYHTINGWQTKVSPLARFVMAKRAWITVSGATFPNITAPGVPPDAVMVYMINNAITPSTAILKHPAGTPPVAGVRTYIYDTYPFVGTSPVTVGTFPVLVAGLVRSSAVRADQSPKWSLSGDGTALFQDVNVAGYLASLATCRRGSVSLPAAVANTGALSGTVTFATPMVSTPTVVMTAGSSRLTCSVSGQSINGFNWSVNNWSPGGSAATIGGWIAQC